VFGSMIDAHEINRFDSCRGPRFVSVTAPIILAEFEHRACFFTFSWYGVIKTVMTSPSDLLREASALAVLEVW
jgi:hypothetical protein